MCSHVTNTHTIWRDIFHIQINMCMYNAHAEDGRSLRRISWGIDVQEWSRLVFLLWPLSLIQNSKNFLDLQDVMLVRKQM